MKHKFMAHSNDALRNGNGREKWHDLARNDANRGASCKTRKSEEK
jgi:hypothetical protein